MNDPSTDAMFAGALDAAYQEAAAGAAEGGVPIGAVLLGPQRQVLATARNVSVQDGDFLGHAETTSVRAAGKQADYTDTVLVTTMTPCWYCAGLVRFLGIGTVVVGDSTTWSPAALEWLRDSGVTVVTTNDERCRALFEDWLAEHPDAWEIPTSADGWTPR